MVLPSTGAISFNNLRTEFGITGPISLGDVRGWTTSYNQWSNAVAMDTYRGKSYTLYRYPPVYLGRGYTWRKSESNRSVVYGGTTYTAAKEQVKRMYEQTQAFGAGLYRAYANDTWYSYDSRIGLNYNGDEWPPSGVFDSTYASSNLKAGFHSNAANWYNNADHTPLVLGIDLPFAITVRNYGVGNRTDCCLDQPPNKWILLGSNDLTNWTTVDSRSGITWSSLGQDQYFNVTGLARYRYWRFVVLRSNGTASYMHVGEVALNAPEYLTTASSVSNVLSPIPYTATPILDRLSSIANIKGAWSMKLLRQAYTGPIFAIRRSTDNATTNVYVNAFGYACTNATFTTTLRSWLGTATAYISTWYDQSGAGNHATQSATGNQPSFTVDANSYLSYVSFPSAAQFMYLPDGTMPANNTNYTLYVHHRSATFGTFIAGGYNTYNQALGLTRYNNGSNAGYGNYWWARDVGTADYNDYVDNNRVTFTYDGSNVRAYTGSGLVNMINYTNRQTGTPNNYIGRGVHAADYLTGEIITLVVFERALSENDRLTLEA